ncbi:MAG: hypothetical protein K8L99_02970 [Anaerolineae bacterium]|nr:hypothetical protein [Anaerolineae bacterium]
MEPNHTDANRRWHNRPVVWSAGVGLLVALLAIVYFNVPVSTVVSWGIFIALMFGSHLLHGGHGSHGQRSNSWSGTDKRILAAQPVKVDQTDHSRGCH